MTETPETSMLDDAWLAAPKKRSRLRTALVVVLAAGLVFLGGIEVQKRYGATDGAQASAGLPGGGFPGGSGGLPGGGTGGEGASGAGAASDAPSAAASGTTTSADAVIGTVQQVKGDVWVVKDLGGTVHRITVGSTAKVVRESTVSAAEVATGSTVDVSGSTDARGQVTATTITIR